MRKKIAAVVVAALATLGAGSVNAASAAVAPSIVMTQPTWDLLTADDNTAFPETADSNFTFHWFVTAPNGVCAQNWTEQDYNDLGGDNDPVLGGNTYTFSLPIAARTYGGGDGYWLDFLRGGYSAVDRITQCNGAVITSNPVHTVFVPGDDKDAQMSYSGTWHMAGCTCFLGQTSHWTNAKNASVSFRTPQPIDPTGVRVALLMPKGPGRGSAALYIDNKYKTTINTNAKTNVNGGITFQFLLTGMQTHLIRVVNLATAGHPRIDLDATINGG